MMLFDDNRAIHLMTVDDLAKGGGGGGGAITAFAPAVPNEPVSQRFDISVLSGRTPSEKYGSNKIQDILDAYQSYVTGVATGKYAAKDAARFGVSVREWARGYLVGAGVPTLAEQTATTTQNDLKQFQEDIRKQIEELKSTKGLTETLVDVIPRLFGGAAPSQPLQSQAYGYAPVSGNFGEGGGGGIGVWLLLGGAAVAAYLIYKRYSGN
jgi:hypothetical protein